MLDDQYSSALIEKNVFFDVSYKTHCIGFDYRYQITDRRELYMPGTNILFVQYAALYYEMYSFTD